jgi:hypothetical protein
MASFATGSLAEVPAKASVEHPPGHFAEVANGDTPDPIPYAPVEHTHISFTDVPVEHETGYYICTRYGLLCEGHHYYGQLGIYLPAPAPVEEEITIPDETSTDAFGREVAKMPISWWRAQCAFRGRDIAGEIPELQDRLNTDVEVKMLDELIGIEKKLMHDYIEARRAQRKPPMRGQNRMHTPTPGQLKGIYTNSGEGRSKGTEGRTGRHSRGGRQGGGGGVPSRKRTKKSRPHSEVMKRFGTKPS